MIRFSFLHHLFLGWFGLVCKEIAYCPNARSHFTICKLGRGFDAFCVTPFSFLRSVSVSQFTLDRQECRLVMLVGNCTAWSMESSLMAKCRATRPLEAAMILSILSSAKLELESTFLALSSSIWNQR